MSILWTIIIGFLAGVIARFLHPGNKYEPKGIILTTLLGIVGALVATYLGQAVGWYQAGEGAGFIGAIVGAIIVLVVWESHLALSGRKSPQRLVASMHITGTSRTSLTELLTGKRPRFC